MRMVYQLLIGESDGTLLQRNLSSVRSNERFDACQF